MSAATQVRLTLAARGIRVRRATGAGLFWVGSLAVGASTFVVLAVLAHHLDDGELAAASAVLSLALVSAVVPGAVQLRIAGRTAGGEAPRALSRRAVLRLGVIAVLAAPVAAAALALPLLAVVLVAVQLPLAVGLGAARGTLIGAGRLANAGGSLALEAAVRLVGGIALGLTWGATGVAAALVLAAAVALGAAWRRAPRGASAERVPSLVAAAAAVGALVLVANADLLLAPRVLSGDAADAYAIAALPAKGIFFALLSVSWIALPGLATRRTRRQLLAPVAATLLLGAVATIVVAAARPLLPALLGGPEPALGVLVALAAAMGIAAATAVAVTQVEARRRGRTWPAHLVLAVAFGAAALATTPAPAVLAVGMLVAQALALAAAAIVLLRGDEPVAAMASRALAPRAPAREAGPALPWPALVLLTAGLTAACLLQAPGRLLADTKLDLAVAPWGFLERSLHLWDPTAAFGQVQNQAVGYLFPIGPFFGAGDAAGVSAWVTQRLWLALVLSVALWGMALLARELRIGRPAGWVLAGAVYALSPAMLSSLAATSAGLLPAALGPWTVLPLARAWHGGSLRRGAAGSGVAVLAMGGVNAVSTLAVLPLPAIWLLTRPPSRRRRILSAWWVLAVALATAWWLVPLALQGRYGVEFTRFTETAATTEATTSAFETLRGTGAWLSYLHLGGAWLPAGWAFASSAALILATAAIAAAGLAGLARRDLPERGFLLCALAIGTVCVAAGYGGAGAGAASGAVRDLLSDPLAPVRNVAKFEPVLRVPLALGLAHLAGALGRAWVRRGALAVAAVVAVVAAAPMLGGDLPQRGSPAAVPGYWRSLASALAVVAPDARTLVVPSAPFGEYRWGRPLDEPLQPLARSPWAVRSLVPLGGSNSTRLLDGVEQALEHDRWRRGLRDALARAGVRYVVARNDLDWRRSGAPRPIAVHDALVAAGLRRVASFGPRLPAPRAEQGLVPEVGIARAEALLPALELFAVGRPAALVTTYPRAGAVAVSGGPESLLPLMASGLGQHRAAVLDADVANPGAWRGPWFVGDGFRRRDTDFGLVRDGSSYTLATGERAAGAHAPPVPLADDPAPPEAVAEYAGVRRVQASSYGSWLLGLPELAPVNAFDATPSTAWVAGRSGGSEGEWVQADLAGRLDVRTARVRLLVDGPWRPWARRVRVTTEAGSTMTILAPTQRLQTLQVVPGPTSFLRVTLTDVVGDRRGGPGAGLRDVLVPGVRAQVAVRVAQPAALVAAARRAGVVPTFAFARLAADPGDPLRQDEEPRLARIVRMPEAAAMRITGTIRPRPGPALDALLTRTRGLRISATSSWDGLPRWRAANALDGSRDTTWIAAPPAPRLPPTAGTPGLGALGGGQDRRGPSAVPAQIDPAPALRLRWSRPRTLRRVRVVPAGDLAAAPRVLLLRSPAGERRVTLRRDGRARFPALRTDRLTVAFPVVERVTRDESGHRVQLPVGLRELDFPALRSRRIVALPPRLRLRLPCGSGPDLEIGGRLMRSAVVTDAGDLVELKQSALRPCLRDGRLRLPAGDIRIAERGEGAFALSTLTLSPDQRSPLGPPSRRPVTVRRWDATERSVAVGPGAPAYLAVRENFNSGWEARLGNETLEPVRLDGWQQGFVLPAGKGGAVQLRFAPDRTFRMALVAGAALAALLLGLALAPGRRSSEAPPPAGVAHRGLRVLAALGALGAVALVSLPALAVVPVLALVARWWPRLLPWLAAFFLLAAAVVVAATVDADATHGAGAFGLPAQLLAGMALAAVLASALVSRKSG